MRTAAALLATTAVLAFAGCGDNDSSSDPSSGTGAETNTTTGPTKTISRTEARKARRTRAKTVAKVNSVCRRANVDVDTAALRAEDSAAQIRRRAGKLAEDYEAAARALEDVGARASGSRLDVGTGVERASQALDTASGFLSQIEAAAEGGDVTQLRPLINHLDASVRRYQATVRRYKFADCY